MEELAKKINSEVFEFMIYNDTNREAVFLLLERMEAIAKEANIGQMITSGSLTEQEMQIAEGLVSVVMLSEELKRGNGVIASGIFNCLSLDNLCISYLMGKGYDFSWQS